MSEHGTNSAQDAERAEQLRRDGLAVGIALAGLTSGMHFSPYFDYAYVLVLPIARGLFITSPLITLYLTSLIIATGAIALAGIPAALYERAKNLRSSTSTSLTIWLVAAAALALPGLLSASGVFANS